MSERNHSKTNNDGPEHDYLSIKEILVSTFSLVISALWFSLQKLCFCFKKFLNFVHTVLFECLFGRLKHGKSLHTER